MRNILYLLLPMISLLLLSCGENQNQHHTPPIKQSSTQPKTPHAPVIAKPAPKPLSKEYDFNLSNVEGEFSLLLVKDNQYSFSNIAEPIILVNFFATWCPPCRGQLPHLNNLQEKYLSKLFILGLLVADDIQPLQLTTCIASQKVNYFISNNQEENQKFAAFIAPKLKLKPDFNLPLMILFVQGRYYTHYQGTVPEEMIESDIKQALNKLKGKK